MIFLEIDHFSGTLELPNLDKIDAACLAGGEVFKLQIAIDCHDIV
ncbi:MAG: hypothetical protein ABMA02_00315 [Saprospiraceae bacterium]